MQDWVVDVVRELGLAGVGLLMFAENLFPPLPSEVIMPLAGYLSAQQELSFWGAVAAGSVGSLAGATFWYWIGRRLDYDRLRDRVDRQGIWLALTSADLDRATDWFNGHGQLSVLLGRLVPGVRTLISIPAGLSGLSFLRFLLLSAIGTVLWTVALAYGGRFLGERFDQIQNYVGPISSAVIAAAVLYYLVRVVRIWRASR